ncbi:MAG: single-stranded DNA-binding protein [Spirochaetaceae bacterium]|nr:single-stranded DNA-binding protein [Spirochaetaceae bacterium]
MNNLNSIILEGNLTRDPVMDKTPKGTAVCHFTVASNRYYKSEGERQEEVGFFDVEVWSRLAETCSEYLTKGRGVRVVGRLKQDRWSNADGELRSRIHIVGEHVEFRARPKSEGTDEAGSPAEAETVADAVDDKVAVPAY